MTQEQKVKNRLKEVGYVDVLWAIDNYMLRLASIIFELKKQGYTFKGNFGAGKDKKNYFYRLVSEPREEAFSSFSPPQKDYSINGIAPRKVEKETKQAKLI